MLHAHPYHIDSLLQLSEVCKMSEDIQMATELIGEQCDYIIISWKIWNRVLIIGSPTQNVLSIALNVISMHSSIFPKETADSAIPELKIGLITILLLYALNLWIVFYVSLYIRLYRPFFIALFRHLSYVGRKG